MKRFILLLPFAFLAVPAQADTIVITGSNGGTATVDRACDGARGEGGACSSDITATGPNGRTVNGTRTWSGDRSAASGSAVWTTGDGRTFTRERTRVSSAEGGTVNVRRTGPRGNTREVSRTRSR